MRDTLIIKKKLLDEIIELQALKFSKRLDIPYGLKWTAEESFKSGFREALIWLKEKGFKIGTVK